MKLRLKISKRKIFFYFLITLAVSAITVFFCNQKVKQQTRDSLYSQIENIPANKVALLLGTSKKLKNGWDNYYFKYRIDAAVELYKAGKIEYIIVSGDNSKKEYNEPEDMKQELIARGIPEGKNYLDFAGFRTLDSIVRAKEIFGQESITIISQPFHNERAVFIAKNKGVAAIGFNAKDVSAYFGFKTQIRELLARVKLMLDLFIIQKQPKFLGERIEIK